MTKQTVIIIMALIYIGISMGLGFYFLRWQKSLGAFFAAGKGLNPIVVGISSLATYSSGWTFVGSPGLTYAYGMHYGNQFSYIPLYQVMAGAGGYMACFILIGIKMRIMADTHGCMTVSDAIYARYRSNVARMWLALGIVIGCVPYLATQVLALGTMMSVVFGFTFWVGAIIGMAAVAVYAAVGGIFAVVYTDVFQGMCMFIYGLVMAVFLYWIAGGPGKVWEALYAINPTFVRPQGLYSTAVIISTGWFTFVAFHPPAVVRMYMIRSIKGIRWAVLVGVVSGALVFFSDTFGWPYRALMYYEGAPKPAKTDDIMPMIMLGYMPGIVAGVAFSGVLAATMSTVDSFLNMTAGELLKGVLYGGLGIRMRPRTEVLLARIFTASYVVVAIGFSLTVFEMIGILGGIGSQMLNAFCVQPLFGLVWRRIGRKVIFATLAINTAGLIGQVFYLQGWLFKIPFGYTPVTFGAQLAWFVFLIGGVVWDDSKQIMPDFELIMRIPLLGRPTLKVPVVAAAAERASS